jgi:hypothetical protein
MGLITNFLETIREAFSRPPYATPCTGDCNQGRNCTCMQVPDLETQRKHQLDDEFNNANWPFPVGPKP